MAAAAAEAEFIKGMDDCHLKPPMLRSVVRNFLPVEKRPFPSPAELGAVSSRVRSAGLLSERHSDTADRKLVEAWRSAVDSWVERIVILASSSASDKCWAGSLLLGVTCEECCSDRFQSSYTIWFQKLLENIQSSSATHIIKVACCSSLDNLFTRLSCFTNLKKDGTLLAKKIIQPALQMLNEDAEETFWDVAANLLCTVVSFFPSSIQQQYDSVEAVLTSKIMAAKCNLNTSKKLSRSLAMLPMVKGYGDSWCLIIQKILITINLILTDAFQGFEEENKSSELMKMIVPPGKQPPPPLGGQTLLREASEPAIRRLSELLAPRVTTLMHSCCIMLTNPYPFRVSIPVRQLLATVGRVLKVDGSFCGSLFPLTTSMHQELICAELPALHLGSLDFLIAIIKGLQRKFLIHAPSLVSLLIEYFRRARMPSLRKKVYSVVQILVISVDVGMFPYLTQEVINNAFTDLIGNRELGSSAMLFNMQSSILVGESFQQNYHKKRKRAKVIPLEHHNGVDLSIKTCSKKSQAPLSVKIAALKALEALLTMDGSVRSEYWRRDVDCLLITVATNACDAGWANEEEPSLLADEPSFADFQLATLEALLASLLSRRTQTLHPYLSQARDLFRRGRQETGSKIATFCAHARLALNVLIRPRGLPLVDGPPPKNLSVDEGFNLAGSTFNNGFKTNLPSLSKSDLELLDEDDEEHSSGWFDKNDGQASSQSRNLNDKYDETTKQFSKATDDIMRKPSAINAEVSHHHHHHHVFEYENKITQNVDVEMTCLGRDETTVDKEKPEESGHGNQISFQNASPDKMDIGQVSSAISVAEIAPGKIDSSLHISANKDSPVHISANMSNHAPNLSANEGKDAMLSYDSDSVSLDSLPDIVDGDPDSE